MIRRYLFIFYSDLQHLDIELLEQVSDRIFLFVAENVQTIPLSTVTHLQKFGRSLKWITTEGDDPDTRLMHLTFLLGKLHEKVPTDIEFAILTDDEEYDATISFVNRSRRKCQRVRLGEDIDIDSDPPVAQGSHSQEPTQPKAIVDQVVAAAPPPPQATVPPVQQQVYVTQQVQQALAPQHVSMPAYMTEPPTQAASMSVAVETASITNGAVAYEDRNHATNGAYIQPIREDVVVIPVQDHGIIIAAAKVRERMLRSGNRPAEMELLKEYIILSTPNLQPGAADRVIDLLAANKDIEVENREILYHF